jgi:hypothetical protein
MEWVEGMRARANTWQAGPELTVRPGFPAPPTC